MSITPAKRFHPCPTAPPSSESCPLPVMPAKRRRIVSDAPSVSPSPPPRPSAPGPLHEVEESCQPSPEPRERTRVRFAPAADVLVVPRWTAQENALAWYNPVDLALFKFQEGTDATLLRRLLAHVPSIHHMPRDVSIYRGLERLLSSQITSEIKLRRRTVVRNVLVEQYLQRRSGVKVMDETRICNASRVVSENAAVWAQTVAGLA